MDGANVPATCPADAFNTIIDAKEDIHEMARLIQRVANLNPDNPEIGAGMLKQLVADARKIIE